MLYTVYISVVLEHKPPLKFKRTEIRTTFASLLQEDLVLKRPVVM